MLISFLLSSLFSLFFSFFFFFNDTATTEIYTLSLHDALPIWANTSALPPSPPTCSMSAARIPGSTRSEEHTSELQSLTNLVCRLLLEKKKRKKKSKKKPTIRKKKNTPQQIIRTTQR